MPKLVLFLGALGCALLFVATAYLVKLNWESQIDYYATCRDFSWGCCYHIHHNIASLKRVEDRNRFSYFSCI